MKNNKVILQARGLSKSYGEKSHAILALKNATFEVRENEIFGLIGADGAGKTTAMKILCGLSLPSTGGGSVAGFDIATQSEQIKRNIGYMSQKFALYENLKVWENIYFFGRIYGMSKGEIEAKMKEDLARLDFSDKRDMLVGALPLGWKQKLALCCALIHKPKILLLDEPSTGVDALSRAEFWEILRGLKSQMSIIVSTPYMDEAQLCDRVALMASGEIFRLNTPDEIISDFSGELFALKNLPFALLADLRKLPQVKSAFLFGESLHLRFHNNADFGVDFRSEFKADFGAKSSDKSSAILEKFLRQKLRCADLEVTRISPNIEDCFMEFANATI